MCRFWLYCYQVVCSLGRSTKQRRFLRIPPLLRTANVLCNVLSTMHPTDVSFKVVETWPHFFSLCTIWVETLPKTVVWTEDLVHGFSVAIQIVLGSKSIPTTRTTRYIAEVLWLMAGKVLLQFSRRLEGSFTFRATVWQDNFFRLELSLECSRWRSWWLQIERFRR